MTAVTSSTLFSEPVDLVYNILNTRTNVADPRDATGARKFIYTTEPFHKAFDFKEFPYIYLQFPNITQEQSSADGKHKMVSYTQSIVARTIRDGSGGSRVDAGVTDMKTITDDIMETFNNETNKKLFRASRLFSPEISLINSDSAIIGMQSLHETEFELSYGMRFKVTT